MAWPGEKPFDIKLGGLNLRSGSQVVNGALDSLATSVAYPGALVANNVRWTRSGALKKRNGYVVANTTAMPGTKMSVTGLFALNKKDGTTRHTIACSRDRIFLVPGSGAWTALVSSLTGGDFDFWDATVFNDELILCNGVDAPQVTDGTAGGSGALVNQASVQTRTAMPTAQSLSAGFHNVEYGTLIGACGSTTAGGYDGSTLKYDTIGDVWTTKTRAITGRDDGPGFMTDGMIYVSGGLSASGTFKAAMERYDHVTDTWTSLANITANRRQAVGNASNNGGFVQTGNDNASSNSWTTTNQFYDPITNAWATKTAFSTDPARRAAVGFAISQATHVATGRITAADAFDAEHGEYNPFTDVWVDLADITASRSFAGGFAGKDNRGYVVGGFDSGGTETNTIYSYTRVTDAWATSAATITTAKVLVGVGSDDWFLYMAGGAVGATAQSSVDCYNVSPAAPVARYVESYKGQVIMARTSAFPSRVFYSAPGTSRIWDPDSWFDVNTDDGKVITGLFVYEGRLYVSKETLMYVINGDAPFDPLDAIPFPVPLEGVAGTNSHRSLVVTRMGVFYQSIEGFMLFDGSRSVSIGADVYPALDNNNLLFTFPYTCAVENRRRQEVWFSLYNGGSLYSFIYNYAHNKWSMFSDMDMHSLAVRYDANGYEEIMFGASTTTNALIYVADRVNDIQSGDFPDGVTSTSIESYYQTGWFSPHSGIEQSLPKDMFMWWKRVSTTAPVVALRANYSASDTAEGGTSFTDTITLTASAQLPYFFDGADQRCRVAGAAAATSHALSLRITETSTNTAWELYGAVLTSVQPLTDGRVVQ